MSQLQRAKVYRNIELRQQWLGLEPFDAIALGALAWLLMLFNAGALGWNLLVVVLAFVGVRVLKRGKPEGYTAGLIRFYLVRRPFFSAAAPDLESAEHPFPREPRSRAARHPN
jgi:hypothetical protein